MHWIPISEVLMSCSPREADIRTTFEATSIPLATFVPHAQPGQIRLMMVYLQLTKNPKS